MKKALPILILLFASQAFCLPSNPLYKENTSYQWLTQMNRIYHHIDFRFSPRLVRHMGLSYRAEYSLGGPALDLQGSYMLSSWQAISVPPSSSHSGGDDEGILGDANSELTRARNGSDPWSQWLLELGYSYRGRLIPVTAKKWTQAARVAFGYTGLSDSVNSKSYSGFSVGVEFSLFYAMNSKMLVGPKFSYRHGWVHLNGVPTSNMTRLPITSFDAGLGVVF
jgi:hypothetical protein